MNIFDREDLTDEAFQDRFSHKRSCENLPEGLLLAALESLVLYNAQSANGLKQKLGFLEKLKHASAGLMINASFNAMSMIYAILNDNNLDILDQLNPESDLILFFNAICQKLSFNIDSEYKKLIKICLYFDIELHISNKGMVMIVKKKDAIRCFLRLDESSYLYPKISCFSTEYLFYNTYPENPNIEFSPKLTIQMKECENCGIKESPLIRDKFCKNCALKGIKKEIDIDDIDKTAQELFSLGVLDYKLKNCLNCDTLNESGCKCMCINCSTSRNSSGVCDICNTEILESIRICQECPNEDNNKITEFKTKFLCTSCLHKILQTHDVLSGNERKELVQLLKSLNYPENSKYFCVKCKENKELNCFCTCIGCHKSPNLCRNCYLNTEIPRPKERSKYFKCFLCHHDKDYKKMLIYCKLTPKYVCLDCFKFERVHKKSFCKFCKEKCGRISQSFYMNGEYLTTPIDCCDYNLPDISICHCFYRHIYHEQCGFRCLD